MTIESSYFKKKKFFTNVKRYNLKKNAILFNNFYKYNMKKGKF